MSGRPVVILFTIVILGACANRDPEPVVSPPEALSIEERLPEDAGWRPGDSQAVPRDVQRWAETDPNARVVPVTFAVQIRNRCEQEATFVVGPSDEAPPSDAPHNRLAAGEAIDTWIPSNEDVVLRDSTGRFSIRTGVSKYVVFVGHGACERASAHRGF